MLKHGAATGLHYSGLAAIARRLRAHRGRFVLMLHDVIPRRHPDWTAASQKGLTVAEADALLAWLKQRFRLLTPEAFLNTDAPGVLITVDDAKANNATALVPLLERYEAPAVFFAPTQHVRDPRHWLGETRRAAAAQWPDLADVPETAARTLYDGMSEAQLRACDAHPLVTIGAHSASHPRLPLCSDARLDGELVSARAYLEYVLNRSVELFAYPYGDYDERVARAVARAGYSHAFAVEPVGLGRPRLEIPRLHIEGAGAAYLDAKTSGLFRRPMRGRP